MHIFQSHKTKNPKSLKVSNGRMCSLTFFASEMTVILPQEKKKKDCAEVPRSTGEVISLHKGTNPINWSPCININCSSASTSAVPSHPATTNFRIAGNSELQLKNDLPSEVKAQLD